MLSPDEILKWLKLGGITLSSMLFLSIVAVAVMVERLLTQRSFMIHLKRVREAMKTTLSGTEGSVEKAKKAIPANTPEPVAIVFSSGLQAAASGYDERKIEAAIDRARQRAGLYLKHWMWILGTIGATTPFIGLFGTVYGIMKAMGQIGETGQTGFTVVAEGISEALITTAVGIAVAIEAVILFNALQNRLSVVITELKLTAEEFAEDLRGFAKQPHEHDAKKS
jgi:biopolymer transport protein ExbB